MMIVISGAGGRLGRLIVNQLAAMGKVEGVTLSTRDPGKISDLAAMGFDTVKADFNDSDSLDNAFRGAETILLISATGPVEKRIALHRNAIEAVQRAGPKRVVYTSRVNPTLDSVYAYAPIHCLSEQLLIDTGVPYTFVRNNEYIENLLYSLSEAVDTGKVYLPGNSGKVPYVAVEDVAEAIAKLLLENGHENKIYELNGAEALSPQEMADCLSKAIGKPIERVNTSPDEYAKVIESRGRPTFLVAMIKTLCKAVDSGEFSTIYPDLETILARPADSLSDYIKRTFG
jgi:NAD(P)H dehydrogenase (quinone)